MRILLIMLILISSFNLSGQGKNSINTDSLKFVLEVIVIDNQKKEPIKAAEVNIIGTDGSSNKFITNSDGEIPFFKLQQNTSYSIVINADSYMLCKGKESTVGKSKNQMFVHHYEMQPMIICRNILYQQYYKHNEINPYKAGTIEDTTYQEIPASFYADVMKENPSITIQVTGYQDESENEGISKERAKRYVEQLIDLGISKKRLVVVDGGVKSYKKFGFRGKLNMPLEEAEQENRTINFKVLSNGFKPK